MSGAISSGARIDPGKSGARARLREEFVDGLRHIRHDDWGHALALFRTADEKAEFDNVYQNRYTSFHGLARVSMGDRNGVKLCRKAAVGEQNDAETDCNLALAAHRLGCRESAYTALRHGLRIDPGHPGLKRLEKALKLRQKRKAVPGLNREGPVNAPSAGCFAAVARAGTDADPSRSLPLFLICCCGDRLSL